MAHISDNMSVHTMLKIIHLKNTFISIINNNKTVLILFLIAGILIYGKSLFNGFVWDDNIAIVESPQMQEYSFNNIFGPSIYNDGTFYRPISALFFFTEHLIYSDNSYYYHLTQLLLHVGMSFLVYLLFKKFFRSSVSFSLSLIFLIHPINTEAVSFISGGQAIIYTILGMPALLMANKNKISFFTSIFITLSFALAILSKEEAIQLIAVVNLYCLLFKRQNFKDIFFASLIGGLVYFVFRLSFAQDNFNLYSNFFNKLEGDLKGIPIAIISLTPEQKILNIPIVMFYYLKTFIFPAKLAVQQIWAATEFHISTFAYPLIFLILFFGTVALIGFKIYKNKKSLFITYLFFLLWFLIGIGTHLPIFQAFDMTVADRWFYFPSIGLLGLIGVYINNISKKFNTKLVIILFLFVVIALASRSHVRSLNFSDNKTLFEHDSRVYNNSLIEQNIADYYSRKNDMKSAIEHSIKSVEIFPSTYNLLNLAINLEKAGYIDGATNYYKQAYEFPSYYYANNVQPENIYFAYSTFLVRRKKFKDALSVAHTGLNHYSESDRLYYVTGYIEFVLGNKSNALQNLENALQISPENSDYRALYETITLNKSIKAPFDI